MLFFSRWKAAAIVITAFVVCLAAVPNFFSERTVQTWPKWMQSRVVLGLDLQGGSHILLQVDIADVRRQKVEALRDDVRRVLRDASLANTNTVRGDTVEVRLREPNAAVHKAAGKGEPVTQEIAVSVKGDKVDCAINGTVVATYDKSAVVGSGKLKSTDGVYGIRFSHNTEGTVSGLTMTKQ